MNIGSTINQIAVHIRSKLMAGLLVMIPLGITVVILKFVFDSFDPILEPVYVRIFGTYTPGIGIGTLLVLLYVIGHLTSHVVGRQIISKGNKLMNHIPIVKTVYKAALQATDVFSSVNAGDVTGTSSGKKVVLVDFPGYGLKSIGLVTGNIKGNNGERFLVVYMPTAPFPTSGFVVILKEDQVSYTSMSADQAMKVIVSAGIMAPSDIRAFTTDDQGL